MEPGELDALVAKAGSGYTSARELFDFMRLHKIHQPELAVLHGGELLSKHQRALGSDVWTIMEQVFNAACVIGHDEWRDYCLKKLEKQWPNSVRVERLKGLHQESLGDYAAAKTIYAKILTDKPEDTLTRKRMITMFKQKGKIPEAIEAINSYLETFSTDNEVWHELAELYIEAGALSRAVYCFEELTIANPRSMYHLLTYAELLYSVGDYELSRKYFCLASYLDGGCLRALWGLFAVNQALAEKDKQNEKLIQMQAFCVERLIAAYKDAGPHGRVCIAMLKESSSSA